MAVRSAPYVAYDVLIVGLGPVGAMCANLLCSRGLRVLVLEQMPDDGGASARPRAINMDDDGMRLLQQLGLLEAFLADAQPLRGRQFMSKDGRYLNGFLPAEGQGRPGAWTGRDSIEKPSSQGTPAGVFFYQPRLEELLRQNLETWGDLCTVSFSTVLVDFKEEVDFVTARVGASSAEWMDLPNGEVAKVENEVSRQSPLWEVRARFVIGCDGSKSIVNRQLNKGLTSRNMEDLEFDEDWCVIDAMLLDESAMGRELPHLLVQICDKARKVTYMTGSWVSDRPEHGRHIRFEFEVLPGEDRELISSHAWLKEHFLSRWLIPPQYEILRSAVYRFHSVLARHWCSKDHFRVFLAGDAAHQNPPFNAQGLTGGFRDVANLSWKLAMAIATPSLRQPLLKTYEEERVPHMREAIVGTIETGRLIQRFCDTADEDLDAVIEACASLGYGGAKDAARRAVGLYAAGGGEVVGQKCPQPLLKGRRLDEMLGSGFALLLSGEDVGGVSPAALGTWPVTLLRVDTGELEGEGAAEMEMKRWLMDYRALLLRPDRLVYGAVPMDEPASKVELLLGQLREDLGLAVH